MAWANLGFLLGLLFLFFGLVLSFSPPPPPPPPPPSLVSPLTGDIVRSLVADLRLFVYQPPPHLHTLLDLRRPPTRPYFTLETTLLPTLLRLSSAGGGCRFVDEPADADFFWVPHALVAHWIGQPEGHAVALQRYWRDALQPFLLHILHDLPYFNRSGGRDHLFLYLMDNGPACDYGQSIEEVLHADPIFHHVLLPMIHIGYHGTQGVRSAFPDHPLRRVCFAPGHDIVIPQPHPFPFTAPDQPFSLAVAQHRARTTSADLHFAGSVLSGSSRGCSSGVRGAIHRYCRRAPPSYSSFSHNGHRHHTVPCNISPASMDSGVFALAPGGWACWSTRFFHALARLAVPVILADGIVEPFEMFLDYRQFTVKLQQPQHLATLRRGFGILRRMAQGFRKACGVDAPDPGVCLGHPVSALLRAAMDVRPWLSYNVSLPQHALLLLLLELRCRRPADHLPAMVWCQNRQNRSARIAHLEYGVPTPPRLATPWLWWGLPAR